MSTAVCYNNPVNALLNDFFNAAHCDTERKESFRPRVDIVEQDTEYHLYADISGLGKKDVSISVEEGVLTISGEKNRVNAEEKKYHYYERNHGSFERRFNLPDEVDKEQITAEMKNGELVIKIKKLEKELAKKIEIKVE